jgi:ABC-type dipeptide/oligopeptide/nickel transport system permease subunit
MDRPQGLKTGVLALRGVELPGDRTWIRFVGRVVRRQPLGAIGGLMVLLLILVAAFAAQLAPYDPKVAISAIYDPPSQAFFMGTDHLGRDIFSRVVWGARLSLYVGLASVSVGISVGALWGTVTGYFGGLADTLSQRVVDTLMGFPPLILALSLMAVLQQSVHNVIVTLAILLIPTAARTLRSTTLSLKEMGYVESARAMGASHSRIIFGHILPNSLATYIVLFTVNVAYAIVVEAALSFLGLGAPPDEPSWGGMLNTGAHAIQRAPWIALFPGLAISLAVFGLNMLGDAIRDLTDVKLRGRESQSE